MTAWRYNLLKEIFSQVNAPDGVVLPSTGTSDLVERISGRAKAAGSVSTVPHVEIAEGTLRIYRKSDNFAYTKNVHFREQGGDKWKNLSIPQGTKIWIDYLAQDSDTDIGGVDLKVSSEVRRDLQYLEFDPSTLTLTEVDDETLRVSGRADLPSSRIYLELDPALTYGTRPYFYKKAERVYLQGFANEVVGSGDPVATLPEGARPGAEVRFSTVRILESGEIVGRGLVPELDGYSFSVLPVSHSHLYPREGLYPRAGLYPR